MSEPIFSPTVCRKCHLPDFQCKCADSVSHPPLEQEAREPQHPFEVRITIGGETWEYVLNTMTELTDHLAEDGPHSICSGGAGGSHAVTVVKRDISIEDFRKELDVWFVRERSKP